MPEIDQELRKSADASRRQVITAPVAGKVLALHVSVGDQVASRRVVAEVVVEA